MQDNEIAESKAFAIRVVACAAALLPMLLCCLHFAAAVLKIDFTVVKEVELLVCCGGILTSISVWAFAKKEKDGG